MEKFKFLEHTADMKFQAFGKSLEEAFENAALAMFNVMYDGKVAGKIKKKIKVSGKDRESLLYNFLEELLFLLDSENFFLARISKLTINKNSNNKTGNLKGREEVDSKKNKANSIANQKSENYELTAELVGDKAGDYEISLDVKAVTYNSMFVKQEKVEGKDKFICQVVVDV